MAAYGCLRDCLQPDPRNKLSKAGFLPCSQPPKQPDMELDSAADGWICHDASENAGYIQVMALFVGENDDKPSS